MLSPKRNPGYHRVFRSKSVAHVRNRNTSDPSDRQVVSLDFPVLDSLAQGLYSFDAIRVNL